MIATIATIVAVNHPLGHELGTLFAFPLFSGHYLEDVPSAGFAALIDQQVMGEVVGRAPETGPAAQRTDQAGYSLQLEPLLRHSDRGLVVVDTEADLFPGRFLEHGCIIGVGLASCSSHCSS